MGKQLACAVKIKQMNESDFIKFETAVGSSKALYFLKTCVTTNKF